MEHLNLKLTLNSNGSITATWSKVAGAVRYHAYMYTPGKDYVYYNQQNLTTTSYTSEANLEANRQYKVIVVAYGSSTSITSDSAQVLISSDFYNNTPLGIPQNIKAVADTVSVTITFDSVTRASGYDVLFDGVAYSVTGTTKKITGLQPKTTHTYAVRAKNATKTGAYSATKSITTLPQTPAVPTNIKKTVTETSVTVSWSAATAATAYDLIFNGISYSMTGTSKTITGLSPNTSYSFKVRGRNDDVSGSYSSVFTAVTAPKPPATVGATSTENAVTVNWSAVSGTSGYILRFNGVEYRTTDVSCTLRNLSANTAYSYQVCARSIDGAGSYTTLKTVKTAPKPPTTPQISTTKNSATISWDAVEGATSYDVMFNGNTYRVTGTSKTITGLTPGTGYSCSIRANNADGSSSYVDAGTITTIPNPPGVPTNVSVSVTANSATVSWGAVATATSYDVMFGGKTYNTTTTSYTITGLTPDQNYNCSVRANNAGGSGTYSASKAVQTLKIPPVIPSGISASSTSDSVTVSWNAVSGASSYDVTFRGSVYNVTETKMTFTGLQANTTYTYYVRSKNEAGVSAYSSAYTVQTLAAPPAAPMNVTATATSDTVTVKWDAVSGATGYALSFDGKIYKESSTSRTITGLKPGTTYQYAVCAENAGGRGAYSPVQSIRTIPVLPGVPEKVNAYATADSVTVNWGAVDGAESYDVVLGDKVSHVTGTEGKFGGLTANTNYSYAVRANNEVGSGAYSEAKIIRTLLAAPQNIVATATTDSVKLEWNPVEGATGYEVVFDGYSYVVSDTYKELTGLKDETEYSYKIRGTSPEVDGEYSETAQVCTLRKGPDTPSDITAVSSMNSVVVSWSPVEGADDYDIVFDKEQYRVSESGIVEVPEEKEIKVKEINEEDICVTFAAFNAARSAKSASPGSSIIGGVGSVVGRINRVFTGLKPNTKHDYAVKANNGAGSSHYSPDASIKTKNRKRSGLPKGKSKKTYPDGKTPNTGLDPVNALTGAFLWSYTWLEDYGKDALHFTTMYDSQRDEYHKALGKKWTYSLNYLLYMDEEYAYFSTPYDEVFSFCLGAENGIFPPADGVQSDYSMRKMEDGSYCIRDIDGAEYVFDSRLCLKHIVENGLIAYRFDTDEQGQICRIEGRHGCYLTLAYMDGHISCVADAMGNKVTFTYENDRLALAVNPDGKGMSFTYDDYGNLLKVTDFTGTDYVANQYDIQGRVIAQNTAGRGNSTVVYDEANRVTVFTDEAGNETRYCYDEELRVTCVELADRKIQNKYNERGQLTEQEDALGNVTKMAYDECGRMNHVIHADGTEEKVFYNDRNYPVRVVNGDGTECSYEYDERNNLISVCDERGNTCSYEYDEADNMVSYTDKIGNVWKYEYDENQHLQQATDPDGNVYGYVHDAIGRLLSHTLPTGRTTTYQYSASGELLRVEDSDGTVTFEYNANGNHTGITDKRGNKQRLAYNDMGQVVLATDFMGNEYHFSYDERGNLIAETDPAGYSTSYTYDAVGNRTAWKDKNGGITNYTFDAAGQLIAVSDQMGGMVRYYYDTVGQVKTVIDPMNHQTAYTYDAAGRVTSVTDALGHSETYTYDVAGNLMTRTDKDGAVVEYAYDKENRLTMVKSDAGRVCFTYDKLGRVIAVQDEEGYVEIAEYDGDGNICQFADKEKNKTSYRYDEAGRLCEETAPNGSKTTYAYDKNGNCIKITDAEGGEYQYEYDANNRVIKAIDPLGYETAYEYDAVGNLAAVTDPKGGKATFEYDGNGNLLKEMNPLGGSFTYTYDRLNRLTEVVDEEGNKYVYEYDAAGNRIASTDANKNRWEYEYDEVNRLTDVTAQDGGHMKFSYTATGRIAKVTDQEGAQTNYCYDALGRLVEMSDALENSLSWTYDSQGRVLTQTDACGNTTEYSYSPSGNLMSVKDPEGNETTYTYNALGQVVTCTNAVGTEISYLYDALGRVTAMTDALGGKISFTYTARGEIATVTNAEGGTTHYTYDACGNLVQTVDSLGNIVEYEYDAMNNRIRECLSVSGEQACATLYQYDKRGRLVHELNPMAGEKAYTYDANGNIATILDEDGHKTVVEYDLNHRPVSMCYSDGREAVFRYNSRGELVELKDWNGITTMEYGVTGKLARVTDHKGRTTGYGYDANGRMTGITYPDGSKVSYAYDKNSRLTAVTDGEGAITQYQYDPVGNVLSIQQSGSTAAYNYNAGGLPTKVKYRFDDGTHMEEQLTYDVMGRLLGRERKGSSTELTQSMSYAYDALGQLMSYKNGAVTESYGYDALGNRTYKDVDGIRKATYQYNAMNQMIGRTENGVRYCYDYDKRGNLTGERRGDSLIRQYVYDATNHMVLGRNLESGEKTEYGYNGLYMRVKNVQTLRPDGWYGRSGQRSGDKNSFVTRECSYVTDYLSGANNELMVCEKGFGTTRTVYGRGYERLGQAFVPETDTPFTARAKIAQTATGRAYFRSDNLGSTLFTANGQGEVIRYAPSDVWGAMKFPVHGDLNAAGLEDSIRYTNYQYDPVIGKYYAQARFYDATTGRMLAKDPVKNGLNAYAYCGNDPANHVDPTGEIPANLIAAGFGAVIGSLAGGVAGFAGSSASQLIRGDKYDLGKAVGAGVNGMVAGGVRGAVLASGAPIVKPIVSAAADFLGGTLESMVEQRINHGKIDFFESIANGFTNAASGLVYGNKKIGSAKEAFGRGFASGATAGGLNNIFGALNSQRKSGRGSRAGAFSGELLQKSWMTMYARYRDPKSLCGSSKAGTGGLTYGVNYGYQSEGRITSRDGKAKTSRSQGGFSFKNFCADMLIGGVSGGLSGVAFYKGDKAVDAWRNGVYGGKSGSNTKDMYRAVGVDEYYDIMSTKQFRGIEGTFAAKEFGNDFNETLDFANRSINRDKVAIIKVTIPEDVYNQLHHMNLDAPIFKSGTPVVEPEMLEYFNNNIISIEHAF